MENTKHTPGPWEYGEEIGGDRQFNGCKVWDERGKYHVAVLHSSEYGRNKADTIANAKLISTAPELLEALARAAELIKTARQHFPKSIKNSDKFNLENTCATINAAIQKATGNN